MGGLDGQYGYDYGKDVGYGPSGKDTSEQPQTREAAGMTVAVVYGIEIKAKNNQQAIEALAAECLRKVGYDVKEKKYNGLEYYTATAKELSKLPPELLAKVLNKIHELSPAQGRLSSKSKMIRRIFRGFGKVIEEDPKALETLITAVQIMGKAKFEDIYLGVDYEPDNQMKGMLKGKLKEIEENIEKMSVSMAKIDTVDAEKVQKLSLDEIFSEIDEQKRLYLADIAGLRKEADKIMELFPSASLEEQADLERKYNSIIYKLDKMKKSVEETFARYKRQVAAFKKATETEESVKGEINVEIVARVKAVRTMNMTILKDAEEKIQKKERPENFGLTLDKQSVKVAEKAIQELESSKQADLQAKAQEGKMALQEYKVCIVKLGKIERINTFKNFNVANKVLQKDMGTAAYYYFATKDSILKVINSILKVPKDMVQQVLAAYRKYFSWLAKVQKKRKEEVAKLEKMKIERLKKDMKVSLTQNESQDQSKIRKNMFQQAKDRFIALVIGTDSMKNKNIP